MSCQYFDALYCFCVVVDTLATRGEKLELLIDKTEDLSANVSTVTLTLEINVFLTTKNLTADTIFFFVLENPCKI